MGVMLQYLITAGVLFSGKYEFLVWHNEHIHIIRIYYLSFMAFTFIISACHRNDKCHKPGGDMLYQYLNKQLT